jgi:iron complex transport system permease protein
MTKDSPTATALTGYRRLGRRRFSLILAVFLLVLASWLVDIMTGPAMLSIREVIGAIFDPSSAAPLNRTVVWMLRLPVAVFALLVGASLGAAGAEMQTILDNPLASPYTLGVSAAASFGAALAIVFGTGAASWVPMLAVPVSAFVWALLASLAIYGVARLKRGTTDVIVLSGVAILFLFNSAVAFMQYVASQDQLQAIVFWMFGSLQGATWPKLAILSGALILTLPLLALQAWKLTALRLGDDRARSLGVDVQRARLQTLILTAVLTATAVCFAGSIGFIGLVAPHLARMMVGEDQRFFLPMSILTGALLLSAASIASKLVIPGAIFPVGIATAAIGVPFFAAMVLGKRRTYW